MMTLKERYPHADQTGLAARELLHTVSDKHIYGDGKGNYWFSGDIYTLYRVDGGEIVSTVEEKLT